MSQFRRNDPPTAGVQCRTSKRMFTLLLLVDLLAIAHSETTAEGTVKGGRLLIFFPRWYFHKNNIIYFLLIMYFSFFLILFFHRNTVTGLVPTMKPNVVLGGRQP